MQKITPFLWFDNQAEEAARFYVSLFKNSRIVSITRYGEAGPGAPGTVMTVTFELEGQEFTALNGGPEFPFSPAISFYVNCETQEEVDDLWERVPEGGETDSCGWVTDKYGVSWQIVPTILTEYLQDEDAERSQRVTRAMLQMKKLDVAELKRAHDQEKAA